MTLIITQDPIDPAAAYGRIAKEHAGSVVFHYAVVKEQKGIGGVTTRIEYGTVGDADGRACGNRRGTDGKIEDSSL